LTPSVCERRSVAYRRNDSQNSKMVKRRAQWPVVMPCWLERYTRERASAERPLARAALASSCSPGCLRQRMRYGTTGVVGVCLGRRNVSWISFKIKPDYKLAIALIDDKNLERR